MCSSCHGEPNHGWCAICEEIQYADSETVMEIARRIARDISELLDRLADN